MPNDREADRRAQLRTRIFAINRETANFYFRNLVAGNDKRGLQYFVSRQLKPETIKKYGLGYAPDSWNTLTDHLLKKGFSDPVVSITDDKVDVVIHASSITDPERAQIEDIVKRKAEVGADQIIITLLNMAD